MPGPMFKYKDTLWSCALFTGIAAEFRSGNLSDGAAKSLNLESADTSLAHSQSIAKTISSCLADHCET